MTDIVGHRVRFRSLTAEDAPWVMRWRNDPESARVFFSVEPVTIESHAAFLASRPAGDLLWMVELQADGTPIAMLSLTVDAATRTAEYGRAYLDPQYRGHGYWLEIQTMVLDYAFIGLDLAMVWLEIFADNTEMGGLHGKYGWTANAPTRLHVDGREIDRLEMRAATWCAQRDLRWAEVRRRAAGNGQGEGVGAMADKLKHWPWLGRVRLGEQRHDGHTIEDDTGERLAECIITRALAVGLVEAINRGIDAAAVKFKATGRPLPIICKRCGQELIGGDGFLLWCPSVVATCECGEKQEPA